ncbi:hypothetical protein, partial [Pseudomonas avellanae]|uniref:hypothetical protein n=1 Tax=Pseudomonas avellanae TaxID=46257 RepID=UPI001ED99516
PLREQAHSRARVLGLRGSELAREDDISSDELTPRMTTAMKPTRMYQHVSQNLRMRFFILLPAGFP